MRRISKILIANRGEIACRIIRTARAMGIGTVAVHSDADEDALHVEMADEAVRIGPAPVAESYLRSDAILAAALETGADAIHPGYGFLSENAAFAEACEAEGIVFIGPTADQIRKMGLKDEAKRLMMLADVPVVPGYLGEDQGTDHLLAEARAIGFPVLIKAVAGGGGKGMRRVDRADDFTAALKAAKREAAGAFGNDQVLIEKYIEKPRHIEVQVFGDHHGRAVYLFERDCSLQRRHQKVIEEAPAPGMPEDLRARMGAAAVNAVRAIGYHGAGTIEFIVDVAQGLDKAPFYFMEMNTRLQVEHPVTEMITGEDLVEWQIRIAAGEPLPLEQDDLAIDGHAIEVRLYAEDPARDFLPATGPLSLFRPPLDRDFARVDTGVREGDQVSVHYDPMIAKIIAWGEDRAAALHHLEGALKATRIAGLRTNLAFLRQTISHPAFIGGDIDTGFIPRHIDALSPKPQPIAGRMLVAAVMAILVRRQDRALETALASNDPWSPWQARAGFRLNLDEAETFRFIDASGAEQELSLLRADGAFSCAIADRRFSARFIALDDEGEMTLAIDGRSLRLTALVDVETVTLVHEEGAEVLRRVSLRHEPEEDAAGPGVITSPMPGKLLDVLVKEGDAVAKDQPLLILEAMKMEHSLKAPRAGVITSLAAKAGAQVEEGAVLVRIGDRPD